MCHWGKRANGVSTGVCVSSNYCWRLACELQNPVCKHNFICLVMVSLILICMGMGGTRSHRLSPRLGQPMDHQIHTTPCVVALMVCCQRLHLLRMYFSSILLFGGVADGMCTAKICEVGRSSDGHLCFGKC